MNFLVPIGTKQNNLIQGNYNDFTTKDAFFKALNMIVENPDDKDLFTEVESQDFELMEPIFNRELVPYKVVIGMPGIDTVDSFLRVTDYEKVVNYTTLTLKSNPKKDDSLDNFKREISQEDNQGKDLEKDSIIGDEDEDNRATNFY